MFVGNWQEIPPSQWCAGDGLDALSVGHAVLPRVKAAIRRVNSASLREFADEAFAVPIKN